MVYQGLPIKNGWIFHGYVSHNQMDDTWNALIGPRGLGFGRGVLEELCGGQGRCLVYGHRTLLQRGDEEKRLGRSLRFVWIHDHMISYAYRMSSRPSLIKYSCWRSNQLMIMQSDVTIHANNYLLKLTIHAC